MTTWTNRHFNLKKKRKERTGICTHRILLEKYYPKCIRNTTIWLPRWQTYRILQQLYVRPVRRAVTGLFIPKKLGQENFTYQLHCPSLSATNSNNKLFLTYSNCWSTHSDSSSNNITHTKLGTLGIFPQPRATSKTHTQKEKKEESEDPIQDKYHHKNIYKFLLSPPPERSIDQHPTSHWLQTS